MNDKYILNEQGEPVPEPDLIKWGRWFQEQSRRCVVKQEQIGNVKVSTAFLGLNYRFVGKGPPILWESMTFSSVKKLDGFQARCSGTRENAMSMHNRMVERVKEAQKKKGQK